MNQPRSRARQRAPDSNGQLPPPAERFKGQKFARVSVDLHNNAKILSLSDPAFRLLVCSWTYCRQQLSDGHLTRPAADALARQQGVPLETIDELVRLKAWHRNGDGYQAHDFLGWQWSRLEVEGRSQKASDSGEKGAAARWHK
jgi:hypothetical protein